MSIPRRIGVRISDDGMEAYAQVRAGEVIEASAEQVAQFLTENEVAEGLLPGAVEKLTGAITSSEGAAAEMLIARGRPPKDGHDGFVTFEFNTELSAGKVEEDGSIDFRERNLVNNVEADQPLATVTPHDAGKPGVSVTGREIPAKPGTEPERPALGHNVRLSDDTLVYLSTIEGHVYLDRSRCLHVSPELRIGGDVDYSTGNIDFAGNVTVGATVKSGFSICAGGDISVRGEVESKARLRAARHISVRGAIRTGTDEARVVAGGNIEAGSIENAWVRSAGNVRARDLLLDARVECVGKFFCERGELRGSEVQAVGGMVVHNVGTEDGVANTLTVGLTRRVAARIHAIEEKLAELHKAVEGVFASFQRKYAEVLGDRAAIQKLPKEERAAFEAEKKTASQRQETINDDVQRLRDEAGSLKKQFHEKAGAVVVATGTVNPPCTVYVRHQDYPLRPGKPLDRVVFFERSDPESVGTEPYDPKRMTSVSDESTYVGAGGSQGDVKDPSGLAWKVKAYEIPAADLAAEIERYSAQSAELAASAVNILADAVKHERYQKPAVYGAEALALLHIAEASEGGARKRAAEKALEVCQAALELDEAYSRAHGTMGRAHYLLGHFNESAASHRKAVKAANLYRTEEHAAAVHHEFAVTLVGIAEALSEKAPERAGKFWGEAIFECEAYLAKEPNGPAAESCRQIMKQATAALEKPAEEKEETPPAAGAAGTDE